DGQITHNERVDEPLRAGPGGEKVGPPIRPAQSRDPTSDHESARNRAGGAPVLDRGGLEKGQVS
ncbi:MAG: hypothetical protein U9R72_03320, partial [Chloroflexota bacterium]|nr:hypothetical protein [Chloroflexota bacterium]